MTQLSADFFVSAFLDHSWKWLEFQTLFGPTKQSNGIVMLRWYLFFIVPADHYACLGMKKGYTENKSEANEARVSSYDHNFMIVDKTMLHA